MVEPARAGCARPGPEEIDAPTPPGGASLAGIARLSVSWSVKSKTRCPGSGFSQEERIRSIVARPRRVLRALLPVLLEKLHQAINQPSAATNHVQPTLMLMLLQNMIQFGFQFGHWNISRIRLT